MSIPDSPRITNVSSTLILPTVCEIPAPLVEESVWTASTNMASDLSSLQPSSVSSNDGPAASRAN